jgi:hypothetical protein
MQLCDEIITIVAEFAGFFGGHLDPSKTREQAMQRQRRSARAFRAELSGPLEQPQPWCPRGRRGLAVRGCCVDAAWLLRKNSLIVFRWTSAIECADR